jgi:hypothetical protein
MYKVTSAHPLRLEVGVRVHPYHERMYQNLRVFDVQIRSVPSISKRMLTEQYPCATVLGYAKAKFITHFTGAKHLHV